MEYLKIANTDISKYIKIGGMKITHEPVWNTSAGRTLTANFVGRIVARKWKVEFVTRPLSQEEISELIRLVERTDFFDVEFIPPTSEDGSKITRTFYVNAPTTTVYTYNANLKSVRYESLAFNIIEQ